MSTQTITSSQAFIMANGCNVIITIMHDTTAGKFIIETMETTPRGNSTTTEQAYAYLQSVLSREDGIDCAYTLAAQNYRNACNTYRNYEIMWRLQA